ncbi:thioredoxin-related transmembrane protein 1-like [Macrobrachium rosenbergii]|uniref:thioredoxin-related transmembrane protein 1-like n=1 Tax=Macrobrachium rosenbergii TaxID=79674 RepID=UPI0034D5A2F5
MAVDRRRSAVLFFLVLLQCIYQISGKAAVIELNEDNWYQMLEGEWMVKFFAPWCPACKTLKPIWEDFASWSDDLGISVGQVDVTSSPGLSGRFMVIALPTIYHVKDGVFRQYRGSRDKDEFMSFIEEKRWEAVEEVPAWKSPASVQMSVVAQFFKLSMVLRGIHSVLVEEYGLPTWGSYLVFALATVVVGALLGLILVCIIDFMFPPKAPGSYPPAPGLKDDDEDLVEDVQDKMKVNVEEAISSNDKDAMKDTGEERNDGAEEEDENEEEKMVSEGEDKGQSSQGEENDSQAEDDAESKSSPEVRRRRPRKD